MTACLKPPPPSAPPPNATGVWILNNEYTFVAFGGGGWGLGTDYKFTGQRDDSYIKLIDYGSRRYDPELGRFIQPDSIVPTSTQGTQAWDRYAYTNNNPVRYNDPTGHSAEAQGDEDGSDDAETCYRPGDGNCYEAEEFYQMLVLALSKADTIYLTGGAIEKLKNDPALLEFQRLVTARAITDPRYGKSGFFFQMTAEDGITFGGQRDGAPMEEQIMNPFDSAYSETWDVAANELTWMVRAADVNATAFVGTDGNITINYALDDRFDLRPDWNNKGIAYNVVTSVLGTVWHDLMGASQPNVYAYWTTVVNPWP